MSAVDREILKEVANIHKVKDVSEDCFNCGKLIPKGEEYYSVEIAREKTDKSGVTQKLCVCLLAVWCKECYEQMQQLLKHDMAVIK